MQQGKLTAGTIARISVLGAIAAILFFFEVQIIGFYKLDLSTLPAMLGAFAMGPVAGLVITAIKNVIGLLHSSSSGVGEVADLLISGTFVLVAGMWYRRTRTRKGALIGMVLGTLSMALVGALANYYIIIPFYINVMGFPESVVIGMMSAVIPAIDDMFKLILFATVPFNLLKGIVLSVATLLLYKRLSPLLHEKRE